MPQQSDTTALYQRLFEHLDSIILFIDTLSGAIIDANPAACTFYGYTHAELTRLTIFALVVFPPAESGDRAIKITQGKTSALRSRHRLANGELREVEVKLVRLQVAERLISLTIMTDVTERKQAAATSLAIHNG